MYVGGKRSEMGDRKGEGEGRLVDRLEKRIICRIFT